ncbi:PAS domain S-box protein [Gimesia chilikensis]|uniref:PAS domain-containing hybrid sensor histidine kinase/response regulator n=1 Tax=Gimesia chilikensis TaxID=2605989 RepID=UPI003A909403
MNPLPNNRMENSILQQVIERTVNGVIITDEAGFTTWINQGFERITGFSADEILGKKPGAILQGPDSDSHVVEAMHLAISNAEPFDVTILNYKKNGETFWNYIECLPLFENEIHTGFLAIQTDVTPSIIFQNQLIEANKRAQENSERLLLAFAGGLVGSWDWNPTDDDLYFHESWENLVGAGPGTLEHKIETWVKRIHPDDVDLFTQQLSLVTRDKQDHFVSEHRILCDQNQYRWTMARGQVVARDQHGNPTRMVGVHLDISEQKRTQRLLDERNDLLQTILDVIPFAVSWKDAESRYLGCNDMFIELTGLDKRENVIGKTEREFHITPEEVEHILCEDRTIIESGLPLMHKIENRVSSKGEQKILDTSKVPLRLYNGTTGLLKISIDITELEMARESLRQNELQLRHSGRMQAVGKLAGGVAHEFNNLLQAIRGYVTFALDEVDSDSMARSDLTQSITAIDRAAKLTTQLLRFSRVEEVEKITCDPQNVIDDLRVLLRPLLPENIALEYELSPQLPQILANPLVLGQALLNLCMNSRDAMPSGGTITIGDRLISTSDDARIGFYVKDTGPGIPENIQDRIFDPFFTTKEVGQGTGLGLAMVYSTAEEHGGSVNFESRPGEGTRFEIIIPVVDENDSPASRHVDDRFDIQATQNRSKTVKSILVAEDDSIVMRVTVRMLENLGYHVLSANNGRAAVEVYRQEREDIKCLVFDISMPLMNGTEAYDEISRLGTSPPIVFCTGYDSNQTLKTDLCQKGYRLINKPFDQTTLEEAINDALLEAAAEE